MLGPRPFNWLQCGWGREKDILTARARLKRRVGRPPRGAAPARPKRRQNTPTSHQKRALVGGWSINITQPPGGVARPRYDTEMAISTRPSIGTQPTSSSATTARSTVCAHDPPLRPGPRAGDKARAARLWLSAGGTTGLVAGTLYLYLVDHHHLAHFVSYLVLTDSESKVLHHHRKERVRII